MEKSYLILKQKENIIDIIYSPNERNMNLFLSTFFLACGIFCTSHNLDFLPENLKLGNKIIYILDEISVKNIGSELNDSVNLVNCPKNNNDQNFVIINLIKKVV